MKIFLKQLDVSSRHLADPGLVCTERLLHQAWAFLQSSAFRTVLVCTWWIHTSSRCKSSDGQETWTWLDEAPRSPVPCADHELESTLSADRCAHGLRYQAACRKHRACPSEDDRRPRTTTSCLCEVRETDELARECETRLCHNSLSNTCWRKCGPLPMPPTIAARIHPTPGEHRVGTRPLWPFYDPNRICESSDLKNISYSDMT